MLSTLFLSSFKPSIEYAVLFWPSKVNGLVTIAIVKQPSSLANFDITGAAPVPVPPPIPAAINTMCAPRTISLISFSVASAASFPTDGSPPAPKPFVMLSPKIILWGALDKERACLSVFAT